MYDIKAKKWQSDCRNEDLLRWCNEPGNSEQPEAQFIRASALLEKNRAGGDVAEAVELMERACKSKHPEAVFAMGQMFYWGWAVHKDKKRGLELYHKAAELGSESAKAELERLRRRKIINIMWICAGVLALLLALAAVAYGVVNMEGFRIIRVHRDTELVEPATFTEFQTELSGLISQYDDELVVSGQVSTNRLLLRLDGKHLDLTGFLADKVIARDDNYIIIQFATEEEAKRCLEELSKRDDIRYVEMDQYEPLLDVVREQDSTLPVVNSTLPANGNMSWGMADMGIDQLREYVAANHSQNEVHVAIIDGGVSQYVANLPEIVELYNVPAGTADNTPHYHGTHVTGTVWEGTRGTNTHIHCIDVFDGKDGASTSAVVAAVDACIVANIDVVNMSMGGEAHDSAKADAVQRAADAGVIIVKSAGNSGKNLNDTHTSCPAEIRDLIVVGAYDINHQAADFTNRGDTVDICAPGVDIYSFDYESPTGDLVSFNGTSMAAPHITALAALIKHIYPDLTPGEMETYIQDYGRTFRNPKMYDTGLYGAGAPDATKFIELYHD